LTEAVAIAAGTEHSCALQVRGTIVCWGSNRFGQLGDNDSSTTPVATPQPVQGIVDAVAIAAGAFHTCAVLVAGTVRCWGANDSGQLGDGTTQLRRAPVTVPPIGIGAAIGVVAGTGYTCILGVRGNVQCWGANAQGQLGDNTSVDRPAPVFARRATAIIVFNPDNHFIAQTATLDQVVALVGGGTHVCAVRVNGQPVCWGDNARGQLGDGTAQDREVAVGVPSFLANIDPAADLSRNGRRAEVTALVNCPEGAHFRVRIRLHQDGANGDGHAEGKCEGGLDRVAVHIAADGRARFDEGAAEAKAVIDVRRKGDVIDHQEWSRVVTLQPTP
jgi:alpha-tubulin suppressor-like RCC1 family protein